METVLEFDSASFGHRQGDTDCRSANEWYICRGDHIVVGVVLGPHCEGLTRHRTTSGFSCWDPWECLSAIVEAKRPAEGQSDGVFALVLIMLRARSGRPESGQFDCHAETEMWSPGAGNAESGTSKHLRGPRVFGGGAPRHASEAVVHSFHRTNVCIYDSMHLSKY